MTKEEIRLAESRTRKKHWKRWEPYFSERAWGTVREDYSPDGNAWEYLPHGWKIIGASKIARDITERKKIERALRESEERYRTLADALETQVQFRTQELEKRNSQLRDLSGRLMVSQDVERRHIARELHDSAGQTLAALGMNLAEITEKANGNPALTKSIVHAENLVQHLTQEIRTTSYLLHPPMLDEARHFVSSELVCTGSWGTQRFED